MVKEEGAQRPKPGVLFSLLTETGDDYNHIAGPLEKQETTCLKHLSHGGLRKW